MSITNEFITAVLTAERDQPRQIGHGPVELWAVVGGVEFSPADIAAIEWQYFKHTLSYFKRALWDAIEVADDGNLNLLGAGFPLEVDAYRRYMRGDLTKRLLRAAENYYAAAR